MITWFKELFKPNTLKKLTKKAERKFKETGKQYLVVPFNKNGSLMLVHGATFLNEYNKKAKRMGYPKMSYPKML